jgi:hypothetical protein
MVATTIRPWPPTPTATTTKDQDNLGTNNHTIPKEEDML